MSNKDKNDTLRKYQDNHYSNKHDNKSFFSRIMAGFRGVKTTEYALLVSIVAIITIAVFSYLGYNLYELFTEISNSVPTREE